MSAVIAQHCGVMPAGWTGVWMFYVISGFVVTASLDARRQPGAGWSGRARFYARRAARLWPIYLAYVTVGFLYSGLARGAFEWRALSSLVLFYNNLPSAFADRTFQLFPVASLWTVSVELQFYLVFGLAFLFLPRRVLAALLVLFLFLAPLLRLAGSAWLSHAGWSPASAAAAMYRFTPMHFDSFSAGALLALVGPARLAGRPARRLLVAGGAVMLAYVAAEAWLNYVHGATGLRILNHIVNGVLFGAGREVWVYSAIAALAAGVLATALTGQAPWVWLLRQRWLQAVGRVSYGGYVYHALCVQWIAVLLAWAMAAMTMTMHPMVLGAARFLLALPLTVAVARLSWRYVERPIIAAVNQRLNPPAPRANG